MKIDEGVYKPAFMIGLACLCPCFDLCRNSCHGVRMLHNMRLYARRMLFGFLFLEFAIHNWRYPLYLDFKDWNGVRRLGWNSEIGMVFRNWDDGLLFPLLWFFGFGVFGFEVWGCPSSIEVRPGKEDVYKY